MSKSDFYLDWAQEQIDRLCPENFKSTNSDEHFFLDKIEDFLKFKKISDQRHKSYRTIFSIVKRFDEDDEAMMVVRGSGSLDESVEANEVLQDEAFNLCDYYQVNGNERNFSVYTLVKKKGKPTGEVGNVAYQYNENDGKFAFTSDVSKNIALLKVNTKLKSVLLFSASMCGISQEELFKLDGVNPEDGLSAFNLLKIIAKVYEIINAEQTQCPTT